MTTKRRITCTASSRIPRRHGRAWAFGYADLSALLGVKEPALRQAVRRGRFDPSNLEAICREWLRRRAG